MKEINVNIIVEPSYQQTPWWRETKEGIDEEVKQSKLISLYSYTDKITSIKQGFSILLGATSSWINNMISESLKAGIRTILASTEPVDPFSGLSYITPDRKTSMSDVVQYLYLTGRRKMAYFGINPEAIADVHRYEGFIEKTRILGIPVKETDIYYCSDNMDDCIKEFISCAEQYDAVICNNDMTAVYFLAQCKKIGISVPRDLYLVGFGNSLLGRCCVPNLTTSILDLFELGRQAVLLGLYLYQHPKTITCVSTIASRIIIRESTEKIAVNQNLITENFGVVKDNISYKSLAKGRNMQTIYELENFLSSCSKLDFEIIYALKEDISYAQIAEKLFIADNTLRYHIERIYRNLGVKSRKDFSNAILRYIDNIYGILDKI